MLSKLNSQRSLEKQKGMVMLMLLMIFAFASIVAIELSYENHRNIKRTSNLFLQNEAYVFALGGEAFAIQKLIEDVAFEKEQNYYVDSFEDVWALSGQSFEVDAGSDEEEQSIANIQIIVEDLQARYNVNNVTLSQKGHFSGVQQLGSVIESVRSAGADDLVLGVDTKSFTPTSEVTAAIYDWIDSNSDSRLFTGGEDDYYLSLEMPYKTAGKEIFHISELKAVKGFEGENYPLYENLVPKRYPLPPPTPLGEEGELGEDGENGVDGEDQVSDIALDEVIEYDADGNPIEETITGAVEVWGESPLYLTALPIGSKINLNTASVQVLRSFFSADDANTLVEARADNAFQDVKAAIASNTKIKKEDQAKYVPYFSVKSEYFQATSIATIGDYRFALETKLHRSKDGKVKVLSRNFSQKI